MKSPKPPKPIKEPTPYSSKTESEPSAMRIFKPLEIPIDLQELDRYKELYKAPFFYDSEGTTVFDANDNMVLQIRGWGRISHSENPESIQDQFGLLVARLLTDWYNSPLKQTT